MAMNGAGEEQSRESQAMHYEVRAGCRGAARIALPALLTVILCMAFLAAAAPAREQGAPAADPERSAGSPGSARPAGDRTGETGAEQPSGSHSTRYSAEEEVYGELEGPRLQFVWRAPGEPLASIWSMKTDGSDLRRAAGPELLYSGDAKSIVYPPAPVRSPDGRYIACAGSVEGHDLQFLIDLAERKVRTMTYPNYYYRAFRFAWAPDSKQVIFQDTDDGELHEYNVDDGNRVTHELNDSKQNKETRQFEEWTTRMYSKGLQIVDGGRRIVGVTEDTIDYLDRAGKVVKRITLPKRLRGDPQNGRGSGESFISTDGRILALAPRGLTRVVLSIANLHEPLYEDEDWYFHSALAPDGKALYRIQGRSVLVVELASGRMSRIAQLPEGYEGSLPGGLTVFGARSVR